MTSTTGDAPDGMVPVQAGSFLMGCEMGVDAECSAAAAPSHQVLLDGFFVDMTEVTVARYRDCVDDGGCLAPELTGDACNWDVAGRNEHPVNCVTWAQAQTFCGWDGKSLLTEAQWEKAARGDDARAYPWGADVVTCERAIIADESGDGCGSGTTVTVGSRPSGASPYGALDMAGNVLEFVADWYAADYYAVSPDENPLGPVAGSFHVARSSAFTMAQTVQSRTWKRWAATEDATPDRYGFRCGKPM